MNWLGLDGLQLLDPWFLLFAPAAVLAALWRARTPPAALPTAAAALFAGVRPSWRVRLRRLPLALSALAACCLAVALARPVQRDVLPLREQGIDIVLAVDASSSMNIADMDATRKTRRMDAARERAREFAAARRRDRVGAVSFARYAELRCPLTLDETALDAFLGVFDTVPEGSELDGTAIGTAVAKAVQVLQKSDAKSKVVVLLTDGENTVHDIEPATAAKLAMDAGLRVHTIGLGNGTPTPFGFQPLDFRELRQIAETTGGRFFQPRSAADLAEVYAQIDELETVELADPRFRTVDCFEWPLAAGLATLLLALLLDALLLRRAP
ncbi:MAG: VWA domain-containing protein [Planctomycetota bacterium]